MKLFKSHSFEPASSLGPCEVVTPLGKMRLETAAQFEGWQPANQPTCFKHLSRSAAIHQWRCVNCTIEQLQVEFTYPGPNGVEVSCCAILCRVACDVELDSLSCCVTWLPGSLWDEGFGEPGEGLEARTWANQDWRVTVGTEDHEFLASRADRNLWMPPRLQPWLEKRDSVVEIRDDRVSLLTPQLYPGERVQLQFVIASAPRTAPDDISTWLVVDQKPSYLLNLANCT